MGYKCSLYSSLYSTVSVCTTTQWSTFTTTTKKSSPYRPGATSLQNSELPRGDSQAFSGHLSASLTPVLIILPPPTRQQSACDSHVRGGAVTSVGEQGPVETGALMRVCSFTALWHLAPTNRLPPALGFKTRQPARFGGRIPRIPQELVANQSVAGERDQRLAFSILVFLVCGPDRWMGLMCCTWHGYPSCIYRR